RLRALYPAEQAGLVLPQVDGVGEHRPALDPDDLLVDKGAELSPDPFHHRMTLARMPAVPCGVAGDRMTDRHIHEPPIQLGPRLLAVLHLRAVRYKVLAGPILVP